MTDLSGPAVHLDGVLQRGVIEFGEGWIVRAKRGEPENDRQRRVGSAGYLFDLDLGEGGDFILERVTGDVRVEGARNAGFPPPPVNRQRRERGEAMARALRASR